jgi:hypothetical protein
MVSVFGDESADETKQRVFAVSAILGVEDQWEAAETAWLRVLDGREFHAAFWESEYADHPDTSLHKKNLATYRQLIDVLVSSGLCAYSLGLDIAAWRDVFGADRPTYEPIRDVEYYKCFTDVISMVGKLMGGFGVPVQFTFDHRQESEYNAGRIYDIIVNQPEWKQNNVFLRTKISFDSRSNPRIQMADLLAREAMKHLDNLTGPVQRPIRRSMLALVTAQVIFFFDYYVREYFESWYAQFDEAARRAGMSLESYSQWAHERKLIDNMSTRVSYMLWLEAQEALGGVSGDGA